MLNLCGCCSLRRAKKDQSLAAENEDPETSSKLHLNSQVSQVPEHTVDVSRDSGNLVVDEFGIQTISQPKRETSSTLEAVKSKLIRHLSHDKHSADQSRSSPSNSEEEIARRAELRRYRAKRIQEELNSEEANSNSTHTSIASTRYLSQLIDIGLPGHGPRDAIEFSINSASHLPVPCSSPAPSSPSNKLSPTPTPMRRWSSCPATMNGNHAIDSAAVLRPALLDVKTPQTRLRSSVSLQNTTKPNVRPPESARIRNENQIGQSPSVFDVWLAAHQLPVGKSPTQRLSRPSSAAIKPSNISRSQSTESNIENIIRPPRPTWNQRTSQRLAQTLSGSTGEKNFQRGPGSSTALRNGSQKKHSVFDSVKILANTSSSSSQGNMTHSAPPGVSSNYPSNMPSIQPSTSHSDSLVNVLSMKDLQALELSPFTWHDDSSIFQNFETSRELSSYATADDGQVNSNQNSSNPVGEISTSNPVERPLSELVRTRLDEWEAKENTLHWRFTEALKLHKRRLHTSDLQKSGDGASEMKDFIDHGKERGGLPHFWRSGNVNSSRITLHKTAFKLNPRPKQDASGIAGQVSLNATVARSNVQSRLSQSANKYKQRSASTATSVAYTSLQRVSRRNASAPSSYRTAKYQSLIPSSQHNASKDAKTRALSIRNQGVDERLADPRAGQQNRDYRSSSFSTALSSIIRDGFSKMKSPRNSSSELQQLDPGLKPSPLMPLPPPRIDEAQTIPALGEIELFSVVAQGSVDSK